MRIVFVHVILSFALILTTTSSLEHILKLHHINCMATPPINVTCSWKEVNTTVGILNVHGFSPYKLSALLLHVQLFYKYQLGGFKPFLIDTVQDFCELSRKDNKLLSLGEFVSRNITGHLINTQCPIEGYFSLKDAPITVEKIMNFFPTGDYRINITLLANSKPIAQISTVGNVRVVRKYQKG